MGQVVYRNFWINDASGSATVSQLTYLNDANTNTVMVAFLYSLGDDVTHNSVIHDGVSVDTPFELINTYSVTDPVSGKTSKITAWCLVNPPKDAGRNVTGTFGAAATKSILYIYYFSAAYQHNYFGEVFQQGAATHALSETLSPSAPGSLMAMFPFTWKTVAGVDIVYSADYTRRGGGSYLYSGVTWRGYGSALTRTVTDATTDVSLSTTGDADVAHFFMIGLEVRPADYLYNVETWSTAKGCSNVHGTVFTGLSHLEGQTVGILADGIVLAQQAVTAGAITIASSYQVKAGLPYLSEFETLNVEENMKGGSLQGQPVKISNVTFRLLNTRGGHIGPNSATTYEAFTTAELERATEIAPAVEAGAAKLFNVDVRVPLGAGYEMGGRVYYKQVDPLPVTISAIIPEVSV